MLLGFVTVNVMAGVFLFMIITTLIKQKSEFDVRCNYFRILRSESGTQESQICLKLEIILHEKRITYVFAIK